MSQKRPRYRYSWKKPWLYDDPYNMRKTITEREAYRKMKILERHSSFKKPYWNYRGHQYGELVYSPPGMSLPPPVGGGGLPRPRPTVGFCGMACLGGILNCKTGNMCDVITCICGEPPYTVDVSDETGSCYGVGGIIPQTCIGEPPNGFAGNYSVFATVTDNKGQVYTVEHPLVDCEDCCDEFTLSGPDTVAQGAIWVGTLAPRCPDATVTATSNSGCTFGSEYVSANGLYVYVPTGDSDCGSVTVEVKSPDTANCTEYTASKKFRITGGAGAWTNINDYSSADPTICSSDSTNCQTTCGATHLVYPYIHPSDPSLMYGWDTDDSCGTVGVGDDIQRRCFGCTYTGCDSAVGANAPTPPGNPTFYSPAAASGNVVQTCTDEPYQDATLCDPLDTGYNTTCYCTEWRYNECEWKCVCP